MAIIENGRMCIKTKGRDAGKQCVVMHLVDENFVKILCAGRKKKRKCNLRHLEPLNKKIDVNESEEKILGILEKGFKK